MSGYKYITVNFEVFGKVQGCLNIICLKFKTSFFSSDELIGSVVRMRFLDTEADGLNSGSISMLCP